jgi:hypothetical protein
VAEPPLASHGVRQSAGSALIPPNVLIRTSAMCMYMDLQEKFNQATCMGEVGMRSLLCNFKDFFLLQYFFKYFFRK